MRRPGRAWISTTMGVLALLAVTALSGAPLAAQTLDDILDGPSGTVSFSFEVADSVEICENAIRWSNESRTVWGRNGGRDGVCQMGLAGMLVTLRSGRVLDLEIAPAGTLDADRELGEVSPSAAAHWLVEVPWNAADEDPAGIAWMTLRLIEGVDVSERVAAGVRDRELDSDIRERILFWAGQMVSDRILGRALADVALGEGEEQDVRDHAIFALSQRPAEESVPLLMELATEAPHIESRRTALFWLAQNDTEAVGNFFAELILDRGGR